MPGGTEGEVTAEEIVVPDSRVEAEIGRTLRLQTHQRRMHRRQTPLQGKVKGGDQDTLQIRQAAVVTTITGLATKVGTVYHHSPVLGRTAVPGDLKETKTSEKLTSTAETTNTNSSTTQCIQVVHTKITEIHILKFLN